MSADRSTENPTECACPADSNRREFLKLAGAASAAMAAMGQFASGQEGEADVAPDHFVPVDKKLSAEWIKRLSARGERTWYSGKDLDTIGMPVGGICAGQVYLTGDGGLSYWQVFNDRDFTGYGRENYKLGRRPDSPLAQGFAVEITSGGKTITRTLDRDGFPGVRFCGEYPIGTVEYADRDVPVAITLEAFSPFIPLNAEDSSFPATLMHYTIKNTSDKPVEMTLAGWLENRICIKSGEGLSGVRNNWFRRCDLGNLAMACSARENEPTDEAREPKVLADFETDDYADWTIQGEAFGNGPAAGTLESQQPVSGFVGRKLVNTYLGGDDKLTGKLTSPAFTIDRKFLSFLIGGGKLAGETCINLLVEGKVVRTTVGKQEEKLLPHNWNVTELGGKKATIEIVDSAIGPWGHINIDQIELRDTPRSTSGGPMRERSDFGSMALAVMGDIDNRPTRDVVGWASLPEGRPQEVLFQTKPTPVLSAHERLETPPRAEKPLGETLIGAIGKKLSLEPGEEKKVTFAVTWHFPNRPEHGNYYDKHLSHACQVADTLGRHLARLDAQTRLWHKTWYDSTLPHWLLDRLFSTVSTLATGTCLRYANGRFWAWEGVGCCHGTCTHVWNYEHAMARLFPELERSCRVMQDYGSGFDPETGMVRFRGEGWGAWAGDGQCGTVLKAYREHQMSVDAGFLQSNWAKIRKSLEFLIDQDANDDGLIEGEQHNTYDINFYGANPMIGTLYLAALRAGQEMAREMGDQAFAGRCEKLFTSGGKLLVERLFNGEFFIQEVDLEKHPKFQTGEGCLADQLFGQGWAHQVGLGHILPKDQILATLQAIWRYNWAPDIGPQNAVHGPERWFARPGEAGLFTCTWPKTPHLKDGVRYKNEIWTGIEYQVAGNLAYDGMVTEALAICRGIHERYHPSKRNPWNEIECGDHYARGMASHGVFLGLCGFEYHGPKGHLGFAPRMTPDDFQAAFTAAEGWGTISQKRSAGRQTNRIAVKWGQLRLETLAFELPEGAKLGGTHVQVPGHSQPIRAKQDGRRVVLTLKMPIVIEAGQSIEVRLTY